MSKTMINAIEITLYLIISSLTIFLNPPIPLLSIPFILIIFIRTICMILEREDGGEKHEDEE